MIQKKVKSTTRNTFINKLANRQLIDSKNFKKKP